MRVLTLTPFYPHAKDDAAGCFVAEPLRALANLGVESYVIAAQPFYRDRVRDTAAAPEANWVHFPSLPGGFGLASAGKFLFSSLLPLVRKQHHTRPFDLIHAHAALPCGHAAALLSDALRIPYLVTVHGLDAFFANQVCGISGKWCARRAERVYQQAAQVICISNKVAEQVSSRGQYKVEVVYNGVDEATFSGSDSGSRTLRLLSVGNLIPIKGHESLLRAIASTLPHFPGLYCDIIGDGPELSSLKLLSLELGIASQVHFLGRQSREKLVEAMRQSTIFVLPSRYEGLGCVYLEAMASKKPAIGCAGQGIDEVIRHGENGWLVPSNRWQELSGGILLLLQKEELRQKIGAAARKTILQGFTLTHQAAKLAQVYEACAA